MSTRASWRALVLVGIGGCAELDPTKYPIQYLPDNDGDKCPGSWISEDGLSTTKSPPVGTLKYTPAGSTQSVTINTWVTADDARETCKGSPYLPMEDWTPDCDDTNDQRYMGNEELCEDGTDQDCDGNDPSRETWYIDDDKDGFGDADSPITDCSQPDGAVDNSDDCDDQDGDINPGGEDTVCGPAGVGVDGNCDGLPTDCAVVGTIALGEAGSYADIGTFLSLGTEAGGALASENGTVVVGGDGAAWTVTWAGGSLSHTELTYSGDTGDGYGEDVAILDGVVAVGAPLYDDPDQEEDSAYGQDLGQVYLDNGGYIWPGSGSANDAHVGRRLEAGAGLLGVGKWAAPAWALYLIPADDLPDDTSAITAFRTVIGSLAGTATRPPAVSIASVGDDTTATTDDDTWVAVGMPSKLSSGVCVQVRSSAAYESDYATVTCDSSSSVLLMDLDHSGTLDLLVGDTNQVAVFRDIAEHDALDIARPDIKFTNTGSALANAGDVNGDTYDDLLIGGTNTAWLVLGGPTLAEASTLTAYATFTGATGAELATDLTATHLDDDDYSDLILGAPGEGGVYIFWGGPPTSSNTGQTGDTGPP